MIVSKLRGKIDSLKLIRALEEDEELTVKERIVRFRKLTKLGRRTYFRCKKKLRYDKVEAELQINRETEIHFCYFCNSLKNVIVHHIDENRENNDEANKLYLCRSCHTKLHRLLPMLKSRINYSIVRRIVKEEIEKALS